jgi:hypothetical protein
VEILNAETKYGIDPGEPQVLVPSRGHYTLLLAIRVHYVGPTAEIPAPALIVRDAKGNAHGWFVGSGVGITAVAVEDPALLRWWIDVDDKKPRRLTKSGEQFGDSLTFAFLEIPADEATLQLEFADLPPIRFSPK